MEKTQEERERELKQIEEYKSLEGSVSQKVGLVYLIEEMGLRILTEIGDCSRVFYRDIGADLRLVEA